MTDAERLAAIRDLCERRPVILTVHVKWLLALVERLRTRTLTCCFCDAPFNSLAGLKEHSAACEKHPVFAENFALAANQCHAGYGDDYGNHRCRYQDEMQRLQTEVERLTAENERLQSAFAESIERRESS